MTLFKIECEGDAVYCEGADKADAARKLPAWMRDIPQMMLAWTEVEGLPEGEELIS